jgi:LemA protein
MKTGSMIALGCLGAAVLFGPVAVGCSANSIPSEQANVERLWANVESTYQSRNDKIPQLVAIVDGSSNREIQLVVETIKARAEGLKTTVNVNPQNSEAMQKMLQNQNAMTTALTNMKMVVERYPQFQASKQFTGLMTEVSGMENRLRVARNDYNDGASKFNAKIRTPYPGAIANSFVQAKPFELFKADEGAKVAPKINFGTPEKK